MEMPDGGQFFVHAGPWQQGAFFDADHAHAVRCPQTSIDGQDGLIRMDLFHVEQVLHQISSMHGLI
jgi:hypothetical protein